MALTAAISGITAIPMYMNASVWESATATIDPIYGVTVANIDTASEHNKICWSDTIPTLGGTGWGTELGYIGETILSDFTVRSVRSAGTYYLGHVNTNNEVTSYCTLTITGSAGAALTRTDTLGYDNLCGIYAAWTPETGLIIARDPADGYATINGRCTLISSTSPTQGAYSTPEGSLNANVYADDSYKGTYAAITTPGTYYLYWYDEYDLGMVENIYTVVVGDGTGDSGDVTYSVSVEVVQNNSNYFNNFSSETVTYDSATGITLPMFQGLSAPQLYYTKTPVVYGGLISSVDDLYEDATTWGIALQATLPSATTTGKWYVFTSAMGTVADIVTIDVAAGSGIDYGDNTAPNFATTLTYINGSGVFDVCYALYDSSTGVTLNGVSNDYAIYYGTTKPTLGSASWGTFAENSAVGMCNITGITTPGVYYIAGLAPAVGVVSYCKLYIIANTNASANSHGMETVVAYTNNGTSTSLSNIVPRGNVIDGITFENVGATTGLHYGVSTTEQVIGSTPTVTTFDITSPSITNAGRYYIYALDTNNIAVERVCLSIVDNYPADHTLGLIATFDPNFTNTHGISECAFAIDSTTGLTISNFYNDSTFHVYYSTTPLVLGAGIAGLVSGGSLIDAGTFAENKVISGINAVGTFYITTGVSQGTVQEILTVVVDTTSPPAQIAKPGALAITTAATSLSFSLPAQSEVANASSYKFKFADSAAGLASATEEVLTGTITKTNLTPNQTYYYTTKSVSASESYSDSMWSITASFTTAQLVPLSSPTVSCTATSSTSVTPTFDSVANASSYLLRYGTTNPPIGDGSAWVSGTAITGLATDNTYYIQVKTVGNGTVYSDSDWSTATSVTLQPDAPTIKFGSQISLPCAASESSSPIRKSEFDLLVARVEALENR